MTLPFLAASLDKRADFGELDVIAQDRIDWIGRRQAHHRLDRRCGLIVAGDGKGRFVNAGGVTSVTEPERDISEVVRSRGTRRPVQPQPGRCRASHC